MQSTREKKLKELKKNKEQPEKKHQRLSEKETGSTSRRELWNLPLKIQIPQKKISNMLMKD